MHATEITPRMVLSHLAALAETDGRIEDTHAHWKLAKQWGVSHERMYKMVYKLKHLRYLEDRVVSVAPGTTRVRLFVTGKQPPSQN